jgi:hypothetical protein
MASSIAASVCQTWLATASLMKAPSFSTGFEFRAIGWQRKQMDAGWNCRVPGARMKAGLIPYHHVLGVGIALHDLLQELDAGFQIDAVAKERLGCVLSIDFRSRVEIAPLILGVIGRPGPRPP